MPSGREEDMRGRSSERRGAWQRPSGRSNGRTGTRGARGSPGALSASRNGRSVRSLQQSEPRRAQSNRAGTGSLREPNVSGFGLSTSPRSRLLVRSASPWRRGHHAPTNDGEGRERTAGDAAAPEPSRPPFLFPGSDLGSQDRPVGIEEMRLGQVEMEWPPLSDTEPRRPTDPRDQLVLDAGKLGEDDRLCTQ